MRCVFIKVRTESVNIMYMNVLVQMVKKHNNILPMAQYSEVSFRGPWRSVYNEARLSRSAMDGFSHQLGKWVFVCRIKLTLQQVSAWDRVTWR
jgi:hypothetical protein